MKNTLIKNRWHLCCLTVLLLFLVFSCNRTEEPFYAVSETPWPESFGNHRAVLSIDQEGEAISLDFLWRRHDPDPANKRFIIVQAQTGDTVPNVFRYQADHERCRIAFGPVTDPGTYYFYYLPYEVQKTGGYFAKDYLRPGQPEEGWLNNTQVEKLKPADFPEAKVTEIQSRTSFDSFFPMEVIPISEEKQQLTRKFSDEYLLFPESRENPIRMKDELPLKWVRSGPADQFESKALRNEYFSFQVGVFASGKDLEDIRVEFTGLKGRKGEIPATAMTCFNTGGIDPYGQPFSKRVDLSRGMIQPLWIGVDIPREITPGSYRGTVTIRPGNAESRSIGVSLNITKEVLADRGDSEPWRHSRLRWLNSTAGMDEEVVAPYTPLVLDGRAITCLGRTVGLNSSGFPERIDSWDTEMLSGPLQFIVETNSGIVILGNPELKFTSQKPGIITWESRSENDDFSLICRGSMEFDGHLGYQCKVVPKKNMVIRDIRLVLPIRSSCSGYMMGMGLPGGFTPKSHTSKWKSTEDSFWIGSPEAGLHCELIGGSFHGPMLNLYKPEPPKSWNNGGKGGFRVEKSASGTRAAVFSGNRTLQARDSLSFAWNLLITPVKQVNYRSQFTDRYYHAVKPKEDDIRAGIKIINVHHANVYNPYINYPFIHVRQMKDYIDSMHIKGLKVKIYYTIRELTNHVTEFWALRSLEDEILGDGEGGGYPWLREHVIGNYRHQWFAPMEDINSDAAIVNSGKVNRWYNYYIEGLAWLVKNVGIDGLYLDDVNYNRHILKRMRKVMEQVKPGCIIDLHSNTGFSLGPANQYAEFFPYIDKLWFGESFRYDDMPPENWLVETSGIPFGLMGDMLQDGGNRWRGMIYGMTARHPWAWTGDPRPVWKVWDDFGIAAAEMKGYWKKDCPVRTTNRDILATAYLKDKEMLVSVASWAEKPGQVKLEVDWNAVGLDPDKVVLTAPEIRDFQDYRVYKSTDFITVEPRRGLLLWVK